MELRREAMERINMELSTMGMTKGRLQWNADKKEQVIKTETTSNDRFMEVVRFINSTTVEDIAHKEAYVSGSVLTKEEIIEDVVEDIELPNFSFVKTKQQMYREDRQVDLIYGDAYVQGGYRNTESILAPLV